MKRKKPILFIGLIILLTGILFINQYSTRSNSKKYNISTCKELQNISKDLSGKYYFTKDLDCSGIKFEPIGSKNKPFNGLIDGKNKTITNLKIKGKGRTALISVASKAKIKNLKVKNIEIKNQDSSATGGLVASSKRSNISGCRITGTIKGKGMNIGGLIGYSAMNEITNSYFKGNITTDGAEVGGLVGQNKGGKITKSYTQSTVKGKLDVGGLVGVNYGVISSSYSEGKVIGNNSVGGLTGANAEIAVAKAGTFLGRIKKSYSHSYINGNQYIGGLAGSNNGNINDSFWDTEASGMTESDGGTGLTTSEMQTKSTYTNAGWDFEETWYMSGYPRLQWEK